MAVSSGRTSKIWRDGQLVRWEDATIHVMSHVVHYGSSVFEGIRCYDTPAGPAIFRLPDHLRRLRDSCTIYRIPLRYDLDTLAQACVETVAANELRHCYLRPVVVRTGVLYTSPLSAGILQGVTRDSVARIARDLGHEVREQQIPREMLYLADELFFTGTAAEITPIRSVDHVPVGTGKPGPVTRSIQDQYLGLATGQLEDRYGWLTIVPDAVPAGAAPAAGGR